MPALLIIRRSWVRAPPAPPQCHVNNVRNVSAGRGRLHDASVLDNVREPTDAWTSGLVHGEPGAAHDGDPAGGDESVESRGEEHMRQAENSDAEAAGQPSEGAGDRRGADEDG